MHTSFSLHFTLSLSLIFLLSFSFSMAYRLQKSLWNKECELSKKREIRKKRVIRKNIVNREYAKRLGNEHLAKRPCEHIHTLYLIRVPRPRSSIPFLSIFPPPPLSNSLSPFLLLIIFIYSVRVPHLCDRVTLSTP